MLVLASLAVRACSAPPRGEASPPPAQFYCVAGGGKARGAPWAPHRDGGVE